MEACERRYGVSLSEWQLSLVWSFIVSVFCIGGLLGTLAAAPLITRIGRWVTPPVTPVGDPVTG